MKKIIITTLIGLFLIGCAGTKSGTSEDMRVRGDVPEWAGGKKAEDAYYGIGMAKKQNRSLAKQSATGRARTEISQAIDTRVNSMLKDFMQESGIGETAQALEFTESVTKQVTSNSLKGSIVEDTYFGKDGTVWVLVTYPLNGVRDNALTAAKSAAREEALYNEFKASQAFKELDTSVPSPE
jgi:hypothetical protein